MGKFYLSKSEILENAKDEKELMGVIRNRIDRIKYKHYIDSGCPSYLFKNGEILRDDFTVEHIRNCSLACKKLEMPEGYSNGSCNTCWYNIIAPFVVNKKTNMEEW